MIVCHCNVLTDSDILSTLSHESRPRTAVQAYRCLGCAPDCGRCMIAVRRMLAEAQASGCNVGCATCPGAADDAPAPVIRLIAAE